MFDDHSPGLGSVAQVVVKTAALRRARAGRGEKKRTCEQVDSQERNEHHFWAPLLHARALAHSLTHSLTHTPTQRPARAARLYMHAPSL